MRHFNKHSNEKSTDAKNPWGISGESSKNIFIQSFEVSWISSLWLTIDDYTYQCILLHPKNNPMDREWSTGLPPGRDTQLKNKRSAISLHVDLWTRWHPTFTVVLFTRRIRVCVHINVRQRCSFSHFLRLFESHLHHNVDGTHGVQVDFLCWRVCCCCVFFPSAVETSFCQQQ